MKVTLLLIKSKNKQVNKDYNGGFGTGFHIGSSLPAKMLEFVRARGENLPFISYAYIAAILKQNGHQVRVRENIIPRSGLVILNPSLVDYRKEVKFMKRIKKRKELKLGLVGPLASSMPQLFTGLADFIICGEPEEAVGKIKDGHLPKGVVVSKTITDLDRLPFPDWSFFKVQDFTYYYVSKKRPILFMQASRNCPYLCNYCPYKVIGRYRARDPIKVVDEMEHLIKTYQVKSIVFRDPNFSFDNRRVKKIAREIIRRKLNIEWVIETRLDHLSEDLLKTMHRAGLRAIKVGIESFNDRVLKKSKRLPIRKKQQEDIIRYCELLGIRVVAFYIIGLPGDTRQGILDTISYSIKLNTHIANYTICTPIPGTGFYKKIAKQIYDHDFNHYDNFTPVFRHDQLSHQEIAALLEKAFVKYYFRLNYLTSFVKRMISR